MQVGTTYTEWRKQVTGIRQCRVQNDKPEIRWDFNIQSQASTGQPTQHSDQKQEQDMDDN